MIKDTKALQKSIHFQLECTKTGDTTELESAVCFQSDPCLQIWTVARICHYKVSQVASKFGEYFPGPRYL